MRSLTLASLLVPFAVLAQPVDGGYAPTIALPSTVNYAVGVAAVGSDLYVANLQEASASGSVNALFLIEGCTGAIKRTVTQGRVLQQLAFDGTSVWAVRMYRTLERLDGNGVAVETQSLPSSAMVVGLAFDRATGDRWELNGGSSTELTLKTRAGAVVRSINTQASHTSWSGLAFDGCSLWSSDLSN